MLDLDPLHCSQFLRLKDARVCTSTTHSLANPALRTAVEMALMAVRREFRSMVRLPVAPVTLRCSWSTNRVNVIVSTSTSASVPDLDMSLYLRARSLCSREDPLSVV